MLTYELKKTPGVPLYEALYRCIRGDILSGTLQPGEKLPSKRALAEHLEVSKITVETAYSQLLSEGYIRSRERAGDFVEAFDATPAPPQPGESRRSGTEETWKFLRQPGLERQAWRHSAPTRRMTGGPAWSQLLSPHHFPITT